MTHTHTHHSPGPEEGVCEWSGRCPSGSWGGGGGRPREFVSRIYVKMSQFGHLVRERQADVTDETIIQLVTIKHQNWEIIWKIYVNMSQFVYTSFA